MIANWMNYSRPLNLRPLRWRPRRKKGSLQTSVYS